MDATQHLPSDTPVLVVADSLTATLQRLGGGALQEKVPQHWAKLEAFAKRAFGVTADAAAWRAAGLNPDAAFGLAWIGDGGWLGFATTVDEEPPLGRTRFAALSPEPAVRAAALAQVRAPAGPADTLACSGLLRDAASALGTHAGAFAAIVDLRSNAALPDLGLPSDLVGELADIVGGLLKPTTIALGAVVHASGVELKASIALGAGADLARHLGDPTAGHAIPRAMGRPPVWLSSVHLSPATLVAAARAMKALKRLGLEAGSELESLFTGEIGLALSAPLDSARLSEEGIDALTGEVGGGLLLGLADPERAKATLGSILAANGVTDPPEDGWVRLELPIWRKAWLGVAGSYLEVSPDRLFLERAANPLERAVAPPVEQAVGPGLGQLLGAPERWPAALVLDHRALSLLWYLAIGAPVRDRRLTLRDPVPAALERQRERLHAAVARIRVEELELARSRAAAAYTLLGRVGVMTARAGLVGGRLELAFAWVHRGASSGELALELLQAMDRAESEWLEAERELATQYERASELLQRIEASATELRAAPAP